jgi:hypothetical protein
MDDFGLKISDDYHFNTPLHKYWKDLAVLNGKSWPELKGVARENFVAGFVGAVAARQASRERRN